MEAEDGKEKHKLSHDVSLSGRELAKGSSL